MEVPDIKTFKTITVSAQKNEVELADKDLSWKYSLTVYGSRADVAKELHEIANWLTEPATTAKPKPTKKRKKGK